MTQSTEPAHEEGRASVPSSPSDPGHEPAGDDHGHDAHGHDHAHAEHPFLQHHFDTPQQQFDAGKLGIWLFLVTEVLFFAGLFCAYTVYRAQNPEMFNYAHYFLDTNMGAINTVVLLGSSLTAAWAVRNAQLGQRTLLIVNILITIGCACTFMVVKYFEYSHKFHDGLLWGKNFDPAHEAWELDVFKDKHPEAYELALKLRELEARAPGATAAAAAPAAAAPAAQAAASAPGAAEAAPAAADPAAAAPAAEAAAQAAAPAAEPAAKSADATGKGTAPRAMNPPPAGMERAPEQREAAEDKRSDLAGPGAEAERTAEQKSGKKLADDSALDPGALDAEQKAPSAAAAPAAAPAEGTAPSVPAGTPAATAASGAATAATNDSMAQATELLTKASPAALKPLVDAGIIGDPARGVTNIGRPQNTHIFFGIYFFMTGLHGLHVLIGIGVWIWMLTRALKNHFGASYFGPIDYAALYWHLVDLIWIYLFPLLYLIH